jgi:hypothetical protein
MEATTGGTWVPTCDFGLSKKQHWGQKMSRKKSAGKTHPKWPKLVMCQRDVLWNEWDGICLFLRFDDNRSRQQGTKMVDDDANDDQR